MSDNGLSELLREQADDDVGAVDIDRVVTRGRAARTRRAVTGAGAGVLVAALVVGTAWGLQPDRAVLPADPDRSSTGETTPSEPSEPTDPPTEPEHGWATVVGQGRYDMVPGDGWWNSDATPESYDDIRSLEHPDTVLIAGFDDAVVEGYVRNPESGSAARVPAVRLDPIPVDPDWPDAWLIIDAHTFEVLDELEEFQTSTSPSQVFVDLVARAAVMEVVRADRFNTEGVEVYLTGDGDLDVTFTADLGYDEVPPNVADTDRYELVDIDGLGAYQQRESTFLTTVALSDTGVLVFLTVGVVDQDAGVDLDDERADVLTAALLPLLLDFDEEPG